MLVACWFAVLKAGGICVTTMPLLRSRELEFIIEKAGVCVALADIELQDDIREASEKTGSIQHLHYFSKM